MAEALKDRIAQESACNATAALELGKFQNERSTLKLENENLRREAEEHKKKVEDLEKQVSAHASSVMVLLERIEKLTDEKKSLEEKFEVERSSAQSLAVQNSLLSKCLEYAQSAGHSTAEAYQAALAGFGGVVTPFAVGNLRL